MGELDAETMSATCKALSGVMMAAAFVIDSPQTWAAFSAFVERTSGGGIAAGPETMDRAIQITDAVRRGLAERIGESPGSAYPPRWPA